MPEIDLNDLLNKYNKGVCSPEELALLETWYAQTQPDGADVDHQGTLRAKNEVWSALSPILSRVKYPFKWASVAAAAVVLMALSAGLFFYFNQKEGISDLSPKALAKVDVGPGGNKAYLTLANGKRIMLTGAENGQLAKEAGVRISKSADGQLVYSVEDAGAQHAGALNTIETPKGGQYEIRLPDGTVVWLNAGSKLIYPVSFAALKSRQVELTGEAYFEVARDIKRSFKVKSSGQEVEVLGTHFNINAYKNEPAVKTTLLEGAVQVARINEKDQQLAEKTLLKTGEQATFTSTGIKVRAADVEEVMAWKNGNFIFNDEDLPSILRKVERWYDMEVIYEDRPGQVSYIGKVSRSKNVSSVLRALEQAGDVHFKIEGRRITVMK
eukprot:gene16610-19729_t